MSEEELRLNETPDAVYKTPAFKTTHDLNINDRRII